MFLNVQMMLVMLFMAICTGELTGTVRYKCLSSRTHSYIRVDIMKAEKLMSL